MPAHTLDITCAPARGRNAHSSTSNSVKPIFSDVVDFCNQRRATKPGCEQNSHVQQKSSHSREKQNVHAKTSITMQANFKGGLRRTLSLIVGTSIKDTQYDRGHDHVTVVDNPEMAAGGLSALHHHHVSAHESSKTAKAEPKMKRHQSLETMPASAFIEVTTNEDGLVDTVELGHFAAMFSEHADQHSKKYASNKKKSALDVSSSGLAATRALSSTCLVGLKQMKSRASKRISDYTHHHRLNPNGDSPLSEGSISLTSSSAESTDEPFNFGSSRSVDPAQTRKSRSARPSINGDSNMSLEGISSSSCGTGRPLGRRGSVKSLVETPTPQRLEEYCAPELRPVIRRNTELWDQVVCMSQRRNSDA